MSNYQAGDTVVCIDAQSMPDEKTNNLKCGAQYVVRHVAAHCTSMHGVQHDPHAFAFWLEYCDVWCPRCGETNSTHPHFSTWRFIKLEPLFKEEDALTVTMLPSLLRPAVKVSA